MNLKKGTENYRKARAKCWPVKTLNLQNEGAKKAHWKRIDRRRVGWWGVISKKIRPLYEDEAKAIEKAIKGKAPAQLVSAAGRAIDAGRSDWEKVLTAVLAALIEDFGNEIADDLDQEKSSIREVVCPQCGNDSFDTDGDYYICTSCENRFKSEDQSLTRPPESMGPDYEAKWVFDPMSAAARAWIVKNGTKSIVTILATNLDDVKRVILAGVDENLTTVQIGRNIRQFYTDRSAFKSMRIARTETSHAAGFGQREAARQSGVVKTHTWLTSRDDRVRDEHAAVDGETVSFGEPYSTGEMYPGEESIMCRCVESYGTR